MELHIFQIIVNYIGKDNNTAEIGRFRMISARIRSDVRADDSGITKNIIFQNNIFQNNIFKQ
jgi:hypothetical protein